MGPGRYGGLGPSAAAVFAAVVVAVAVVAIVSIGGGFDRPLLAPTHVATTQTPQHQS
jgi:hypothetical protein